jgi:hypothetical protein
MAETGDLEEGTTTKLFAAESLVNADGELEAPVDG